jgi:hypothetical protein
MLNIPSEERQIIDMQHRTAALLSVLRQHQSVLQHLHTRTGFDFLVYFPYFEGRAVALCYKPEGRGYDSR